jgi:holo-[acyl-carrier protein] synthase
MAEQQIEYMLGHGIDLVENARVGELLDKHGERFLDRVFTPDEQAYAARSVKRRIEHLAARFAAKEAALKAIGTGWRDGITWTDVEVAHAAAGAPLLRVTGEAARIASACGITRWLVSLSHTETHSMASVIAIGVQLR